MIVGGYQELHVSAFVQYIVLVCQRTSMLLKNATEDNIQPSRYFSKSEVSFSYTAQPVVYPGIFFGRGSTNSIEDRGQRGWGSGGSSPLVRGSGGSCNLVQEISFHIVKFS